LYSSRESYSRRIHQVVFQSKDFQLSSNMRLQSSLRMCTSYQKNKSKNLEISTFKHSEDGVHVFVLMHGLDGSYVDMIPLMNEITLVNSNTGFILPRSVKREKSRGEIDKLGMEVAEEIRKSLDENFDDWEVERISFICHSLGGVIIREAITHLLDFSGLFF